MRGQISAPFFTMKKIPEIDPGLKIVNEVLQPYFDEVYRELHDMSEATKLQHLQRYVSYIEAEAQKAKRLGTRMQLRINLRTLLEKLNAAEQQVEVNVKPKPGGTLYPRFDDEAYTELYDESGFELA